MRGCTRGKGDRNGREARSRVKEYEGCKWVLVGCQHGSMPERARCHWWAGARATSLTEADGLKAEKRIEEYVHAHSQLAKNR